MIKIPMAYSCDVAIVDDWNFWVQGWAWRILHGYAVAGIRSMGGLVRLHRLVLGFPPYNIDHINGNKLDCQIHNLRAATQPENCRNRRTNYNRQYKGIYYNNKGNGPYARIVLSGKQVALGRFQTDIEAALAYDKAALLHFGEFACLNFPERKLS